jgi:ABC-type multidrug transport system fused ATPase/permease subunit
MKQITNFKGFLGVISNVAVVAAGAKYVAIVIPFLFGLLYLIQYYYLRTSRQMRLLDLEAKNPLFSELTESSDGLQHIRAFKWEQEFLDRGLKVLDHSQKPFYYMYCIQRWLNLVLDLAVAAIAVLLVALGFTFASTNQAALGLSLFIIMRVGGDMSILIMTWANLETSLGAVARIRDFEAETPREGSEDRDVAATLPAKWPHHGAIELDNVTAEYTATNSDFKALHNLSLQISAGSKVGLIGRTGSGKSSLLLTLLNFLKYTGTITIDGIDISTVPPHVLRSRITTISQGLVELPCSVRDNLVPHEIATPSEECTDAAKLFEVLDRVGLKDEIEKRGGLDGMIAEVGLSAGEKQLFALARALLQNRRTNSKIVLVDEATSNIDYESEKKMQQVMEEAFEGCTVLTIAHRQHTIQSADVVHELSAGRLVTSNTP